MASSSKSTVVMREFGLPLEKTIVILSRLPVKSLLRFKSVCKSWYDLIKTPHFISKHLSLTQSTCNHTPLLGLWYNLETKNNEISLFYNHGFEFNKGPIELDFPFRDIRNSRYNYLGVVGICNGLVCITLSWIGYPLVLCNPSTRQFREIPNGTMSICLVTRKYNIRADLYAMSTDTWTEIDSDKLSLFFGKMNEWGKYDSIVEISRFPATALNGIFYWPAVVVSTDEVVVMSFDMGNEVFRRISTPMYLDRIRARYLTYWQFSIFTELNDNIAMVVSCDERGFNVLVLIENESCWTNQIKVEPFPRIAIDMGYEVDFCIEVLGGRKNGELLMI